MLEIGGGLLAVLFLVFLNGFFVAAEFALVTVRSTRVQQLLAEGAPGSRNVDDGVRNLDSYIAACQFGITLASLALGWIGEPALAGLLEPVVGPIGGHAVAVAIAFAIITALHVIAGELAPKGVALQYPERVALIIAGPLRLFRALFRPAIWVLNESGWIVSKLLGVSRNVESRAHLGADELRLVVSASREAGELNAEQEFMLQRVFRFSSLSVESVMTPRPEVIAIPAEMPVAEATAFAKQHRHSRYPVFRDDLDNVIGVLHARDLLLVEGDVSLDSLIREPLMVPAQLNVQELLRLMRVRRTQTAIAVDEYGGTDGIVTLENVLEEIVGELQDEFEVPEETSERRPGGIVRIDAAESADALAELLGVEVESGPYKTVAGLLLEQLREIPQVGDTVDLGGYRFAIVEMDDLRIATVEARRLADDAPPEPQAESAAPAGEAAP
ncbi:MAG: HlyC/CorC family transporter [Chloroflexi bacterium]|nr:HlyC/CorC family transporter [Chloroflexota bacterium]MYE45559.1 HlyC/CorC family transporter [Chloroflexota bacterium]